MGSWQSRIVGHGEESPDQLLANPSNWRIHPKSQQDALAKVLDTVGWVQEVIVNKSTNFVIDGHLRVALAISKGEPTIPVVYVDLTEDEEQLILASLDSLAHMAVVDDEQLTGLLDNIRKRDESLGGLVEQIAGEMNVTIGEEPPPDPGAQMDRAEELRGKWGVERGQIWEIGRHRLMCGDSTSAEDVAELFQATRCEMVWTDPPYGVAIGDKNKFLNSIARSNRVEDNLQNDTLDEDDITQMLSAAFDLAIDYCLAGGAWYVAAPAGPLHILFGRALKERGIWRQTIQWVKNNATFSPMGVDYHWRAEPIFYGWLPDGAHRYYGGRKQDTVWEIDRPAASPEHPTMKPVELAARAIANSSQRNDLIYDLFLGSGTTMIAAEQLGRICYGMEIDPRYVAVTLQRLADMGLTLQLVNTLQVKR